MPDPREIIARRVAQELRDNTLVNLGIGLPTMVSRFVPPGLQALISSWSPAAGEITGAGMSFWVQISVMAGIAVITAAVAAKLFRWE